MGEELGSSWDSVISAPFVSVFPSTSPVPDPQIRKAEASGRCGCSMPGSGQPQRPVHEEVLCDLFWGDIDKHLFPSDGALLTDLFFFFLMALTKASW